MDALFHTWPGILSFLPALAFWLVLASKWSSASPKRFSGVVASMMGMTLMGFNLCFQGVSGHFAAEFGIFFLLSGGLLQARDRQEMSKLPKGTRIKRVVNSVRFLGIPLWRKVVSTEILPPEK